MSSDTSAMRRLRQITSQLAVKSCSSALVDVEGEAVSRFVSPKIVIMEFGERGVPLMPLARDSVINAFKKRSLNVMFVDRPDLMPDDTTVIITSGAPVGLDLLSRLHYLKLVAVAFTGVDHVDLAACRRRGVVVCNVPDYSTNSTAELVLGLILSQLKRLPQCHDVIANGQWAAPPQDDLQSKTVGIVGVGKLGLRLACLFKAFGVKALRGYDPCLSIDYNTKTEGYPGWTPKVRSGPDPQFATLRGLFLDSLAGLFLEADIICICVPLTERTHGLISETLLNLLRPDSLLVNASRGAVIDELALARLLKEKRFRAALDVFGQEPLPLNSSLRSIPSDVLLMTPHVGYQSPASLEKRLDVTLKNILAFLAGSPINTV